MSSRECAKATLGLGDFGDDERLLTVPDVAQRLGVGKDYAYDLVTRGGLPHVRIGRLIRVRPAQLARWVSEHEASS
jgi:excisionase family DNA binding protein